MRRIAFVLTLVAVCSAGRSVRGQEGLVLLPIFRAAVEVVPISALVRDRRGRIVTTLTQADFEVRDKGDLRPIIDFQVDARGPVSLAVLVDTSGSMSIGSKLPFAREVLRRLGDDLQEGRDEVSLFTFDAALREEQPFTPHPARLDSALDRAEPFGVTSLYDAIAETARRIGQRPARRRAIVVVTDGVDTNSALTPPEVSALASAIDATVYIVATVAPIDYAIHVDRIATRTAQTEADLRDLALWTGGDVLWVSGPADAAVQARQILSELRHEYLITIESAAEREWRPLEVRVRDRKLAVRARSGYFSRDDSPPSK